MLRQVQTLLMALQAVQLAASTLLPMELYEIAHSHQGGHSEAISLHSLLMAGEHFPERKHPMVRAVSTTDESLPGFLLGHETPQQPRRHRKSATKGGLRERSSKSLHRQGRQMVSEENSNAGALSTEPKIYYAVGVSIHLSVYMYY